MRVLGPVDVDVTLLFFGISNFTTTDQDGKLGDE